MHSRRWINISIYLNKLQNKMGILPYGGNHGHSTNKRFALKKPAELTNSTRRHLENFPWGKLVPSPPPAHWTWEGGSGVRRFSRLAINNIGWGGFSDQRLGLGLGVGTLSTLIKVYHNSKLNSHVLSCTAMDIHVLSCTFKETTMIHFNKHT